MGPAPETAPIPPDHEAEERQLRVEKLRLEIEGLRNRRRDRVIFWLPMVSALVAVGGLLLTANQFFTQQNKDRQERVKQQRILDEAQIRTDLTQLVSPTKDHAASAAQIVFLLEDLARIVERVPAERDRITQTLLAFILQDADFDSINDIRLETATMQHWPEYGELLRQRRSDHEFLLYRYLQGLRHLHDLNPKYFESIEYDPRSGYKVGSFVDEALYLRFLALVAGFSAHLIDLKTDTELRNRALQRFEAALNNPAIVRQLFFGDGSAANSQAPR
jgi:hypothetical protein